MSIVGRKKAYIIISEVTGQGWCHTTRDCSGKILDAIQDSAVPWSQVVVVDIVPGVVEGQKSGSYHHVCDGEIHLIAICITCKEE